MIGRNKGRFLAMLFIIMVGICFITGIGGITPKLENSVSAYYERRKLPDLDLKSKSEAGFTKEDLSQLEQEDHVEAVTALTQIDDPEKKTRVYIYPFDSEVNRLKLVRGHLPEAADEVAVEQKSDEIKGRRIGDTIQVSGQTCRIVGIVSNPLFLAKQGDVNIRNGKYLDTVIYFSEDANPFGEMAVTTDAFVKFDNVPAYFDQKYKSSVSKDVKKLAKDFGEENYSAVTMQKNVGYASIREMGDKIRVIALAFPLFFILIVLLVTLTNMSRLVDEERKSIGCLVSLGYSTGRVVSKYVFFSLISTMIGIVAGLITGARFLPDMIYQAFNMIIFLPERSASVDLTLGLLSSLVMVLSVFAVTLGISFGTASETPAHLFRPRSRKPGKKILLERIRPLWSRLSFRYKSTWRNIFRFKGRFWMIVLSVAGSTLLVVGGLGLYDASVAEKLSNMDTMRAISVAVIVFALLLSILVLYNITTMNIGERQREIATLMVLGYQPREVESFIYREIVIMATIGIVLGIPGGMLFLNRIFVMMDFSKLSDVRWYSYVLAFAISELFVWIVVRMTRYQIRKVDMNDSLKSVE